MKIKIYVSSLFSFIFFLYFSNNIYSQNWLQHHKDLENIVPFHFSSENSKPNDSVFASIVGANGEIDLVDDDNPIFLAKGVINNIRNFHDMSKDFGGGRYFPRDGGGKRLRPNICDCENVGEPNLGCGAPLGNCDEDRYFMTEGENFPNLPGANPNPIKQRTSPFVDWKQRYCDWKKPQGLYEFNSTYATLENPNIIISSGCNGASYFERTFPNKWYSETEWGFTSQQREENAKNYAISFAESFCPDDLSRPCLVDVLEVGNEPWGKIAPTKNAYHDICRGIIDGLTEYYQSAGQNPDPLQWRMKLSTAAFEAHNAMPGCETDGNPSNGVDDVNQYIEEMIPVDIRPYFSYVNVHNYPWEYNYPTQSCETQSIYPPESPDGRFLVFKNLEEWRRQNMSQAKLNITEFGWNSEDFFGIFTNPTAPGAVPDKGIGEANQAAYMIRAFLIAARYGIEKAFSYRIYDDVTYIANEDKFGLINIFGRMGIFKKNLDTGDLTPKKVFFAIEKMTNTTTGIGNKRFLKALKEDYQTLGQDFAYLIGDADGTPTHLVAWKSDDLGDSGTSNDYPQNPTTSTLNLPSGLEVELNSQYFYLGWKDGTANTGNVSNSGSSSVIINGGSSESLQLKLSGLPVVIPLKSTSCKYDNSGGLNGCGSGGGGNGDCTGLNFAGGNGEITVTGFTSGAAGTIDYIGLNTGWSNVNFCNGNCTNPAVISGLAAGTYTVKVNMQLSGGGYCYREESVTVSNSSRVVSNNVFDLSANTIQKIVQLEWVASQTDETERFIIEKSIDGIHFKSIKEINNDLEDYYFKNQDENPGFGNNYYRIKQQFASGEFRYSPIRKETFHLDKSTITLYPNPAKDELWVNLGELSMVDGNITIYNMLGQKITQKALNNEEKQLRFNVSKYQNGLYYLTIEAKGNRSLTQRFVVENLK